MIWCIKPFSFRLQGEHCRRCHCSACATARLEPRRLGAAGAATKASEAAFSRAKLPGCRALGKESENDWFQHVSTCFNMFQHVSTCFNIQHASICFNMF